MTPKAPPDAGRTLAEGARAPQHVALRRPFSGIAEVARDVTGQRARLQVAGLSSDSRRALAAAPARERIVRPLEDYVRLVEALR